MKHDVIVIGAGIGGLSCAARLAAGGKRVLALETDPHVGGTSYIFRRGGYGFPMGPLSFGFPERIVRFLEEAGLGGSLDFHRNHFALAQAEGDIVISHPLHELRAELERLFPAERQGLVPFFSELEEAVSLAKDVDRWHPDYRLDASVRPGDRGARVLSSRVGRARQLAVTPCAERLRQHLRDERLVRLLGSQGMSEPEMSMLKLGFMWNVMSEVGIWFPAGGIHGLNDRLAAGIVQLGGEVRTSVPVARILVRGGKAVGVRTARGVVFEADWVVSNADAKTTFLRLLEARFLPEDFRRAIAATPYTGSELRVYLGLDPARVDLSRLKAGHVLFRAGDVGGEDADADADGFAGREIEACLWSDNAPELVPRGRAALILGTGVGYEEFARFRTGPKTRTEDYQEHKRRLVRELIRAVGRLLPGLESAIEVLEAATPLTYRDWGHRPQGSIAGWSWSVECEKALGRKLLVETPVPNLLLAGIYAASELFLGGIPTSVHTASLAADRVLGKL
jgi:phytoene dehydrogenase-like protein